MGRRLGDRAALVRQLFDAERTGRFGATVYSDLDYLLWGLLVEERLATRWRDLLDELVCAPLVIARVGAATRYAPGDPAGVVECRLDNGKEVELARAQDLPLSLSRSFLQGVPQDGNARALLAAGDGIEAAHAGLFVTADEMLALAREWLTPGKLLRPEAVERALAANEDGQYAVGWHLWSEQGSGGALSPSSIGHTGFTGGSVWIDRERERIYVTLAHRLSSALDFTPFRLELHRRAAAL
jgi:CubicO group peptidase (beta-lactamase class C family)